jgi:hypothetical protein
MHNFKELKIWQRGMELAVEVYRVAETFPKDERFGLTSQVKRCVVSVPSNISEGAGRATEKQFRHFWNSLWVLLMSCKHKWNWLEDLTISIKKQTTEF